MSDVIDKLRDARDMINIGDDDLAHFSQSDILTAISELDTRLWNIENELREMREK